MQTSFFRLGLGMIFAVVLVYLLMAVNFQSWLDPFIILTALPGAMAGILWMLFVTGTTLSVPSLMGAIMCDRRRDGQQHPDGDVRQRRAGDRAAGAREAMLSAGYARIRPVLMTATAMILGMLPMALGLGEGGEQNAPLGRAVIGGLLVATVTTLFVVPIIYRTCAEASRQSGAAAAGRGSRRRTRSSSANTRGRSGIDRVGQVGGRDETRRNAIRCRRRISGVRRGATISALLFGSAGAARRRVSSPATCRCSAARHASSGSGRAAEGLPRLVGDAGGPRHGQNVLKLPGTMQALTEAPILARADGYLKRRLADIGDRVQAGQVLAEIDAPELDQQMHQAEAAIEQAQAAVEQAEAGLEQGKANRELARITAGPHGRCWSSGGFRRSRKAISIRRSWPRRTPACRRSKRRSTRSAAIWPRSRRTCARLQEVQGYRLVKAPFDGVITLRNVDVGALVEHRHHAAVPHRADRHPSDLRQRPAGQRQRGARRPGGDVDGFASSGPQPSAARRADSERARSRQPHDAGRGRRAERGRRAVSGNLRRGRSERLASPTRRWSCRRRRFCSGPTVRRSPSCSPTRPCICRRSPSGATTAIASKSCRAFGRDDDCRGARRRGARGCPDCAHRARRSARE